MRWVPRLLMTFLSLSLLGAIFVAGVLVYVLSAYNQNLPDYRQLKDYKPPVVSRIYAGGGDLMAEYAKEKRIFIPIESIPAKLKNAVIAAEDKNFYQHDGLDYLAIARASITNMQNFILGNNRRLVGASTITQQVAKNFLLTNEVKFKRKIREAILAYRMEQVLSKDRLLELYLNEIYLGGGTYGVAAAALHYFNKSLSELNYAEAAYLAGLPKGPANYHPVRNKDEAIERRNWVLDRMVEEDMIHESQATLAKAKPLVSKLETSADTIQAPYYAEEVRRELIDKFGEKGLYGGGLLVHTSMDPNYQKFARQALREGLMSYDRRHGYRGPVYNFSKIDNWPEKLSNIPKPSNMLDQWKMGIVLSVARENADIGFKNGETGVLPLTNMKWARKALDKGYLGEKITSVDQVLDIGDVILVQRVYKSLEEQSPDKTRDIYGLRQIPEIEGAIVAIDPHTGRILAMQGGWSFEQSEFNRATQAWRQPGSAFKPFVYLPALEKGFTPATLVLDAPFVIDQGPTLKKWRPSNYSKEFYGPTPLRVGIERSRNLMTVRLAEFLGMETIIDYATKFEIVDNMRPLLANALGASETTLMRLTAAYAMLVNGGKKINTTLIDRVQDRRGRTIFRHDKRICPGCGDNVKWERQEVPKLPDNREQIVDPRHAYQIVSMLKGVVERGTGVRINTIDKPLAGKTGTTDDSKDTWFIGFSPDLAVGVYVGFDTPRTLGDKETGSNVAAPIFKSFMQDALKDKPATPFRVPPGIRHVMINQDTGARAAPSDKNIIWEAFVVGSEPTDEMYILDGKGISVMPDIAGTINDPASTGTGGLY